jgi:hypothetical protein
MNDQRFFVNVLNQLNVDEYFQPYVVILLLDVILLEILRWGKESFFKRLLPASFKGTNSCPARPWSLVVHVLQTMKMKDYD